LLGRKESRHRVPPIAVRQRAAMSRLSRVDGSGRSNDCCYQIVLKKSCFCRRRRSWRHVFELWRSAKRRTCARQRSSFLVMPLPGSSACFLT
jgi:hypothetical protein